MDRLFLYANILFTAAHRPQGKSSHLFASLSTKRWRLLSSYCAIEEFRHSLRLKFPGVQANFEKLLTKVEVVAQPAQLLLALPPRIKDLPILAAALAVKATHLLAGASRDFGKCMNQPEHTGGVTIQPVAEYLSHL